MNQDTNRRENTPKKVKKMTFSEWVQKTSMGQGFVLMMFLNLCTTFFMGALSLGEQKESLPSYSTMYQVEETVWDNVFDGLLKIAEMIIFGTEWAVVIQFLYAPLVILPLVFSKQIDAVSGVALAMGITILMGVGAFSLCTVGLFGGAALTGLVVKLLSILIN